MTLELVGSVLLGLAWGWLVVLKVTGHSGGRRALAAVYVGVACTLLALEVWLLAGLAATAAFGAAALFATFVHAAWLSRLRAGTLRNLHPS